MEYQFTIIQQKWHDKEFQTIEVQNKRHSKTHLLPLICTAILLRPDIFKQVIDEFWNCWRKSINLPSNHLTKIKLKEKNQYNHKIHSSIIHLILGLIWTNWFRHQFIWAWFQSWKPKNDQQHYKEHINKSILAVYPPFYFISLLDLSLSFDKITSSLKRYDKTDYSFESNHLIEVSPLYELLISFARSFRRNINFYVCVENGPSHFLTCRKSCRSALKIV